MIRRILIYSRPWEIKFHIALGEMLGKHYQVDDVRYVTFFDEVRETCSQKGLECLYLPELLKDIEVCTDDELVKVNEEVNKAFGVDLNVLINGERFLPETAKEIDVFLRQHVAIISKLVKPNTLSISSMYDHFVYCLAGALANARGGIHFAFVGCGVPGGRVLGLKTPSEAWKMGDGAICIERLRKDILTKKSVERIEYMRLDTKNTQTLTYFYKRILWLIKTRKKQVYDKKQGSYFPVTAKNIFQLVFEKLFEIIKSSLARSEDNISVFHVDDIEVGKGIYIALHMEPEATLLVYSPWFRNQIEFIRMISVASPVGTPIYVKENPKMVGIRSKSYYKEISSIPSVYMVSSDIESSELIRRTCITASIFGTVSLEAYLLNRPTITIGKGPFHSIVDFCIYDSSINSLNSFISQHIHHFEERSKSEGYNKTFYKWSELSFEAKSSPIKECASKNWDGGVHIPSDKDNVIKYFNAIVKCISDQHNRHL